MRDLEQDNAILRSHVNSRNAEITRLREVVQGLQSTHGHPSSALPPSDDYTPLGPGTLAQVRSLFIQREHPEDTYRETAAQQTGFCTLPSENLGFEASSTLLGSSQLYRSDCVKGECDCLHLTESLSRTSSCHLVL